MGPGTPWSLLSAASGKEGVHNAFGIGTHANVEWKISRNERILKIPQEAVIIFFILVTEDGSRVALCWDVFRPPANTMLYPTIDIMSSFCSQMQERHSFSGQNRPPNQNCNLDL